MRCGSAPPPPDASRRSAVSVLEIGDSYTLIPEDQPVALAAAIDHFIRTTR